MENFYQILWTILGAAGTALATWLVAVITNWINKKIKDKKLAQILSSITVLVTTVVQKTFQVYVETLKENGKFDIDAQHAAKSAAIAEIERQLTVEQREYILSISTTIREWLDLQIEAVIYQLKNA